MNTNMNIKHIQTYHNMNTNSTKADTNIVAKSQTDLIKSV